MGEGEFEKHLGIRIGGLGVQLLADQYILRKGENKLQSLFAFPEGEPHILLKIHLGEAPFFRNGRKIAELRDGRSCRTLYYTKDCCYILQSSSLSYPYYYFAKIRKELNCCDIYFSGAKNMRKRGIDFLTRQFQPLFVLMCYFQDSFKGLFMHASAISDNGHGRVFIGKSGSGKSTLARLWSIEKGCTTLCDDIVIVREKRSVLRIYGTPWTSDTSLCSPKEALLKELFFIKHAKRNAAHCLFGRAILESLLRSSLLDFSCPEIVTQAFDLFGQLVRKIPCYELGFVPNKSIVDFIRSLD